jgi:hypothetical protein
MPILFNSILDSIGLQPDEVVLLRHQDNYAIRSPYQLWRDDREAFDFYQGVQNIKRRPALSRPIWASFVGTPDGKSLFTSLYIAEHVGLLDHDRMRVQSSGYDRAGSLDLYRLIRDPALAEYEGKLYIAWGNGQRAFVQRADRMNKPVSELRDDFSEPPYPGHLNLISRLSEIMSFPQTWIEILKNTAGVYLLTCPDSKEQYVGSASGAGGFWQRWVGYATTGHGGNVRLKNRDKSDYQICILQVAGSGANVLELEAHWKSKLQTREMGLNGN